MGTPWGMINARREAAEYRQEAWQSRKNETILRENLASLIAAVKVAINDLQKVEASKPVRDKLQEAINNASKGMTEPKGT